MHSNNKLSSITKLLDNKEKLELCAMQCGIFGDITKLKICYLLRYYPDLSVTQIAELVGFSISNTSHSLAKLKKAKLVSSRRSAKQAFYSLEQNAFEAILSVLGEVDA